MMMLYEYTQYLSNRMQNGVVQGVRFSHRSSKTLRSRVCSVASSTNTPCTTYTNDSFGVVVATSLIPYGSGTRKGLLVEELKKKRNEKACILTLAHHYANSNNVENYLPSRIDIGLSMVAKIRVSDNGHLDFTVDGPCPTPFFDIILHV